MYGGFNPGKRKYLKRVEAGRIRVSLMNERRRSDRLTIIKNKGGKCKACGDTENLQLDHIKPIAKGGTNDLDNLQVLCKMCNLHKGQKTIKY